jgi:hypothetical protein
MKNVMNKTKYVLMTLLLILAFSCSKDGEDGMDGTIGPQGEQGPAGQDGIDGEDGNANIIASEWIEPTEDSYSVNNARYKVIPLAQAMDIDVIQGGTILVYYDNDVEVHLLPYYNISSISSELVKSVTSNINHASRTLYARINKYTSDIEPKEYLWDSDGPAYGKGIRFRYVIIPKSESGKNTSLNFEKMTYEEVMGHINLVF